jgi:NADH dehydrogenase
VRALANDGWRIRAVMRNANTAHFLRPMGRVGQIQLLKGDVRNTDSVTAALRDADAAVNLVGILAPAGGQNFETAHVEGAARVADAARAHGVGRLLHVSALGTDAESPARYARTKAEGERRVRDAFPDATIFRPSIMFGPEDDFFNKFGWLARMSPVLPLIGGGRTRFQPVFVGDVAQAVARALDDPGAAGKIFELGGPEVLSFADLMRIVLKQTNRRRILLPIPFGIARVMGAVMGLLPNPMLTLDQVRLLEKDNVAAPGAPALRELGVTPTAAEAILPSYLWRFRKEGEFETVVP